MVNKSFEQTIRFYQVQTQSGETIRLPIVAIFLIQPDGNRVQLPLLFDTGASVTTLRHDLYSLLGVPSWDSGQATLTSTAGGQAPVTTYEYTARLEFLGKAIDCPVQLAMLPPNPLYLGLFGRAKMFEEFGFGFWEKDADLFVTGAP